MVFLDRVVAALDERAAHAALLAEVPRARRAILDADGMYNQVISVDGYDRNHANEHDRPQWLTSLRSCDRQGHAADLRAASSRVSSGLPFYGYDPLAHRCCREPGRSTSTSSTSGTTGGAGGRSAASCCPPSSRSAPHSARSASSARGGTRRRPGRRSSTWRRRFGTDPDWLRRLRIQVQPAVPLHGGHPGHERRPANIMTQRPLFRHLKLLTSKYFEIFAADTSRWSCSTRTMRSRSTARQGASWRCTDPRSPTSCSTCSSRPQKYREIVEEVRGLTSSRITRTGTGCGSWWRRCGSERAEGRAHAS